MYSSSSSAMHHIFFPPRLKVVFLQPDPNCLASCPGDQFAFDRFLGPQPHGPTRIAWRGIGANHGDNPLALTLVQQRRRTGPLSVVECTIPSWVLVAAHN